MTQGQPRRHPPPPPRPPKPRLMGASHAPTPTQPQHAPLVPVDQVTTALRCAPIFPRSLSTPACQRPAGPLIGHAMSQQRSTSHRRPAASPGRIRRRRGTHSSKHGRTLAAASASPDLRQPCETRLRPGCGVVLSAPRIERRPGSPSPTAIQGICSSESWCFQCYITPAAARQIATVSAAPWATVCLCLVSLIQCG